MLPNNIRMTQDAHEPNEKGYPKIPLNLPNTIFMNTNLLKYTNDFEINQDPINKSSHS